MSIFYDLLKLLMFIHMSYVSFVHRFESCAGVIRWGNQMLMRLPMCGPFDKGYSAGEGGTNGGDKHSGAFRS